MKILCCISLVPLLISIARAQDLTPAQFQDGDVVCFIGDSITHSRKYHSYVYEYYLTRFPERHIRFVNCGIAGDSAAGALSRFDWDILPTQPNVACIMFGMNDVGRGLYGKHNPDAQTLASRQRALDNHRQSMAKLAERLRESFSPRFVFITPSIYDDTAQMETENLFGVNAALGTCGGYARDLAAQFSGGLVDFHGPMTALNLEHQKLDPTFTLVGPDRVHPGDIGQLVMAYLFLKAQRVPSVVSRLVLDADALQVVECENAQVSSLSATETGVRFDYLEHALPFPLEQVAAPALELVPFEQDLDQEMLTVRLKQPGTYRLLVDDKPVGDYSSEQLSAGVNLALNAATPQFAQAQALHATVERRRGLEIRLRSFAQIRMMLLRANVDEADEAAVQAYFADFLSKNQVNGAPNPYFKGQFDNYLKTDPEREQLKSQIDQLTTQLWEQNKPVAHHYELRRLPG